MNSGGDPDTDSCLEILIDVRHRDADADVATLRSAISMICTDRGFLEGEVSVSIVGDGEMQRLHRDWLGHNETTDVIAFPLECRPPLLAADMAICWDVACESAVRLGCSVAEELLLYIIHGTLHVTGEDDTTDAAFEQMRSFERLYMERFGYELRDRNVSAHPEDFP